MIEQHNSLSEQFIKKWFWLYLFSFIVAPLWYLVKIIISWDLSVEEIGIIYWVMSLMTLVWSFNDFWLTESLNKFIPQYVTEKRYDKVKSILMYAFLMQMGTWIIVFTLFFIWAEYLSLHYFKDAASLEVIQVFALFFLWINIFQIQSTLFQAAQDTFANKLWEFVRMIFVVWYTLLMFSIDAGNILSYSYAWLVWLGVGIVFNIFYFYKYYYTKYLKSEKIIYDKNLFVFILKYAFLVFLWSQASTLLSQVDMQMIIYMLWNRDAWYYTNYLSIISIPFMIIGPIFALMFPIFSEMFAKWQNDKIKMVKEMFSTTFLSFSIVFSFLFFVFWPQIAYILFGEKFVMSGIILQWSILFLSFLFLLQINFNIFAAIGQITTRLYIILFWLLVNIITNIIFINLYGVAWAALATGIGWIVIWGLSEYFLKDYYINYKWKYLFKNIWVFALISYGLWIFIVPLFAELSRWIAFWLLAAISLLYFAVYGIVNKKDFEYFIGEVKKLRNKKQ